ncbi:hypothetical protein Syun_022963 [Stephania yunnanensis]|uniref:Uncharacterized protein n=1 Tax=Stephania yunnanensis TaxID=152371 RepID=A0AAP0FG63_9MAGN
MSYREIPIELSGHTAICPRNMSWRASSQSNRMCCFGILLLEILSSRRNASFRLSTSPNLIEHAWKLWKSERVLELIDPTLRESFSISMALRCIYVGLLCVQEQAVDRPTMFDVLMMLNNEAAALSSPKQPAFCPRSDSGDSNVNMPIVLSVNNMPFSVMEAR